MFFFIQDKDEKGFLKDFKSLKEVKQAVGEMVSDNFEGCGHMLTFQNKNLRIWVLSTKENIYFIMDNKERVQVLYSSSKKDFDYDILKKDRPVYGEILFSNAKKPLPFDKGLTGDTATFEKKLNIFLHAE